LLLGAEVVKNRESLATYEPTCPLQYAGDKACSPSSVSKSLTAELVRRAGGGLTDGGNIYSESPPSASITSSSSSSAAAALRRCQSLLDTATTTTALSWQQQQQAPVMASPGHQATRKQRLIRHS